MKLRPRKVITAQLAGSIGITANLSGRLSFRRSGLSADERFDALEGELQDLQAKQRQDHDTLQRKIDGLNEAVGTAADRLESERRQRLIRALLREEAGIWIFILGLALTTAGAIV